MVPSSEQTDTSRFFSESLFAILYFPAAWQTSTNEQMYPILVAILTAGRAHGFADPYTLPDKPVASPPEPPSSLSYSIYGIAGADGAASNGAPLEDVFKDIVATTRDRTPTCMSSIFATCKHLGLTKKFSWCGVDPLVSGSYYHVFVDADNNIRSTVPKWPVRSVEAFPTFTNKTFKLSNRVLVIGNSVGPFSHLFKPCCEPSHDRSTPSHHWRARSMSPNFLEATTRCWLSIKLLDIPPFRSTQLARIIFCWTFY